MKKKKWLLVLGLLAVMILLLAGCSQGTAQQDRSVGESVELNISAAASLKNAMEELKLVYEAGNKGTTLIFNYGSSGDLQKQIENGAPTDIFISAAQKQMDALEQGGLLTEGTRENLLKNKLVVIEPKEQAKITAIEDLAKDSVGQIALGEPSAVPAGQYAEESLKTLGILDVVKAKAVYGKDVTQVLTYVENGEVDAGMVYETDAKASDKVTVVTEAPAESYKAIVYPMAVMKASSIQDAAKNFELFLKSKDAKSVLEKYGFTPF